MISQSEFLTYLLYVASIVVCIIKVGLLVRVRTALFDLPPAQRGLVTILADNNLWWCLTMVLTGGVIVARVLGVPGLATGATGRFLILGTLVVTSTAGLVRLGRWFLYDDDAGDRGRPATDLSEREQIERLILLLQRQERRRAGHGTHGERRDDGIPD